MKFEFIFSNRPHLLILSAFLLLIACEKPQIVTEKILYESEAFKLTNFGVTQGNYEAFVKPDSSIVSNYFNEPRELKFKFALNGVDNEMGIGVDHKVLLYPDSTGNMEIPTIDFGNQLTQLEVDESKSPFLEPNAKITFRVNLNPVIDQISKNGVYKGANNHQFKGFNTVSVLGSKPPLDWDFSELNNQLKDENGDGIYELSLTFNPIKVEKGQKKWALTKDISRYPQFTSDNLPLLDALYSMSLEELEKLRTDDGFWDTGAKWSGVWTRDMSYSILLSLAYLDPETAKACLLAKVKNDRIIQDTGTGGSWPISSDRMTWSLAAWEIYQVTGDLTWLEKSYGILKNSVNDDLKNVLSADSLIYGETSFADWREQSYPTWMKPVDIYSSEAADNGMIHYQTWSILAQMAYLMNDETTQFEFEKRASELKQKLNATFWQEEKGYYGQFTYGNEFPVVSDRAMALAESFGILFDVADEQKQSKIASSTPVVAWGIPTFYPQIPNIPAYHNNGIWPFVQAFWNLSLAKVQHEEALTHGLATIWRAAALFLTNKENMRADNGFDYPTEINSDRQIWSVSGNLAMYYRVFMGMSFEKDGLHINPIVPTSFSGSKTIKNFTYRNATVDVTVNGFGKTIKSVMINGEQADKAYLPSDASGKFTIQIELDNQSFGKGNFNLTENLFSLAAPNVSKTKNGFVWNAIEGAKEYEVYRNGVLIEAIEDTAYSVKDETVLAKWQVKAIAENPVLNSFMSNAIDQTRKTAQLWSEIEWFGRYTRIGAEDFQGYGFVKSKHDDPQSSTIKFNVFPKTAGDYWIDFRYSNGNGPINTENKTGIRSLFVDEVFKASIVFPQRGTDAWSDWGMSNRIKVNLKAGKNVIELRYEAFNANMNGDINELWLDAMRMVKAE